jgi:hypothetical protein
MLFTSLVKLLISSKFFPAGFSRRTVAEFEAPYLEVIPWSSMLTNLKEINNLNIFFL